MHQTSLYRIPPPGTCSHLLWSTYGCKVGGLHPTKTLLVWYSSWSSHSRFNWALQWNTFNPCWKTPHNFEWIRTYRYIKVHHNFDRCKQFMDLRPYLLMIKRGTRKTNTDLKVYMYQRDEIHGSLVHYNLNQRDLSPPSRSPTSVPHPPAPRGVSRRLFNFTTDWYDLCLSPANLPSTASKPETLPLLSMWFYRVSVNSSRSNSVLWLPIYSWSHFWP